MTLRMDWASPNFTKLQLQIMLPFVLGGAQDNGCKELQSGASTELTGGDGMECHIDYSDPTVLYTESQNREHKYDG